jgi:protein O-GlcNAc transferase
MNPGTHDPMQQTQPPPSEVNALLVLYNARRYAEAESRTRTLLEQYPQFGFGWKLLGGTQQMQGKDAQPAFQKVVELMPNDAEAHYNLGVILKSKGQLNQAATSYQRAITLKPEYAEAHSNLGNTLKDLGQLKDALASYRRALKLKPGSADTHNNLGTALKDLGQLNDALTSYRQAIALQPDFAWAHYNLGNAQKQLGQLDEALHSYRRAITLKPDFADAHNNLGTVFKDLGQFTDALDSYRRVLELKPDYAEAHNNLGVALKDLGQLDAALASYHKAVELKPDYADAHNNLGTVLQTLGQPAAALISYRRAIDIEPGFAEAHSNLGNTLKELGQLDEALASCRRAIALKPDFADAYNNLGIALKELGQLDAAQTSYRRALQIKPDFAEAYNNLGSVLKELGQMDASVSSYRKAIQIKPDYAEAHSNLGIALKDLGQHDDALASYRRALALKPDFVNAQTNLLFTLNYTVHTPEYCLEEAQKYGRMADKKVTAQFSSWSCTEKPERLRVGMVSGDLHNHPVGHFLESVLAQIDPTHIELIAYPTDTQVDELTIRIKPYFSAWKSLHSLSDEAAARLIHADGVHVLLDLSGHTGKNRLPIFSWKPAPVQANWLGYFATTGVAEMDYLLTTGVVVPQANQRYLSESVWYLPDTWLCFTPPKVDLSVVPLPALQNGYLTFGCFQRLDKMGDAVLTAWANIFMALPNARLQLDCKQLGDSAVVKQQIQRFEQYGIDPTRVLMRGAAPTREAYLARYAEVDVMLDTFPYPGVTTTCEALWMGVPTLTLAGDTLLSRQGAGVLTAAGLPDWVTTSASEYIAKAIALADDLPKLAELRAGLREQVSASPLFDAQRFARNLEEALWGMWQARSPDNSPAPRRNQGGA